MKKENLEKLLMLVVLITAVFILALIITKCENETENLSPPEPLSTDKRRENYRPAAGMIRYFAGGFNAGGASGNFTFKPVPGFTGQINFL